MEVGYLHIENLYRCAEFLQCFALEKVHGTSAHISYKDGNMRLFSGGESQGSFTKIFDQEKLTLLFSQSFTKDQHVTIYGEAFGGRCQGMSDAYGKSLRFIAFDVKIGGIWLDVPSAEAIVKSLDLEFVPYERGPLTLAWLDEQRDRPSLVSVVPDAKREGIIVRPIYECVRNNGERVIFKHKRDEFRETKTPRQIDPEKLAVLTEAGSIADEWVVPMRLSHVLQKTPYNHPSDTGNVIKAMIEDVKRESEGEVVWTKDVEKAISRTTAKLLKSLNEASLRS